MNMRQALWAVAIVVPCLCPAQWPSVTLVGQGGEPNLAADGIGHVYLTCHQNAQLFISNDWGANFLLRTAFQDSCCDLNVMAKPTGRVIVTYVSEAQDGIKNWTSPDFGVTLTEGSGPAGPLDREWSLLDSLTGNACMVYSKGYVGGPASTGIFFARSTDAGLTYVEMSRADNEMVPGLAVDPYLATSSNGRIYSMWSVTTDNDTIDRFGFATSTDGGLTFTGQKTIATLHKSLGDTQERWMFGSLVGLGPSKVYGFYSDYQQVNVDGTDYVPLLVHYVVSNDGGNTFSAPATLSSPEEIADSIRNFEANKIGNLHYPYYVQTQPWACTDPWGRVHVVYQDNRDGQSMLNGQPYDMWHVRHATGWNGFGKSDRVSASVRSLRPPLDFVTVAADARYIYASWVESQDSTLDWVFTGDLYVARTNNILMSPVFAIAN